MEKVFVKVTDEFVDNLTGLAKNIVKVAGDRITVKVIGDKSVAEVTGTVKNIDEILAEVAAVIVVIEGIAVTVVVGVDVFEFTTEIVDFTIKVFKFVLETGTADKVERTVKFAVEFVLVLASAV